MHRIGHILVAVLLAFASIGGPAPASAQDAPAISDLSQAEKERLGKLFSEAKAAFESGDYVQAIDRLQRAHRIYPDPDIYYRIGQAYEGLQDHTAAIDAYRTYLDGRPDADDRNIVQDRIRNLERLLAADRDVPGVLLVETEPEGAKIWLDSRTGYPIATSPARLELSDGEHFLYVSADGYDEVSRKVVIRSGQTSNIVVALNPTHEAPAAEGAIGPWVMMGTGGALVVAGGTTMFLALSAGMDVDEIDAERRSAYSDGTPIPERTDAYDDAVRRERQMWVSTAILGGAGLALLTSGLVWWFIDAAKTPDGATATVGLSPTGATLRVTF